MNYGPVSQEQLETLRAASSQISKTWDQLVEPIKKFGEKYGTAQISESGGFMDRTPAGQQQYSTALGVSPNSLSLRLFISSKGDDKWQNRKRQKSDRNR